MKKVYMLVLTILGAMQFANAQNYVHQVIFLNEGWYDYFNDTLVVAPTLGVYDPIGDIYTVFDTIQGADFGSDVLVDGNTIYVAADSMLLMYDKNSLQQSNMVYVDGIRKLAVWNNQLLVTRGKIGGLNSYFQVYDKNSLTFAYELNTVDGPSVSVEGVTVLNDTAYLAVNNSFDWGNEVGFIGIIDLNAQQYVTEIDMGANATNPDNLMSDGTNLYTLNNKDFTSSSITVFDPATRAFSVSDNIAANSGCATSALANSHVHFMEYGVDKLARFNIATETVVDTLSNTLSYYGLVDDQLNGQFYATWTDYSNSGMAYRLDYNGTVLDSFAVGISAGSIALDIRNQSGIEELVEQPFAIYPNPAKDYILVSGSIDELTITDMAGRVAYRNTVIGNNRSVDISTLPSGVYIIGVAANGSRYRTKLIKQ